MGSCDRRAFFQGAIGAAVAPVVVGSSRQDEATVDIARIGRETKTRFAINAEIWWSKLPFLDRIRQAAAHGFPAVEFWPFKGKDLEAIARVAGEVGIEIAQFTAWGFTPGLNDPKNHDQFENTIREACGAAKLLRCKKMTVVAGNDQPGMTQADMHRHVIEGLRRVARIVEAEDVMLILEPMNIRVDHKGHCLYGSEAAVAICRAVGSTHVKINWDLYHMQISEGDLCGRLKEGFDQVGYLQVADHPGRHEPGTGEICYPRVLQQAYELGYRGFVGAECWPSVPETDAARALARAGTW